MSHDLHRLANAVKPHTLIRRDLQASGQGQQWTADHRGYKEVTLAAKQHGHLPVTDGDPVLNRHRPQRQDKLQRVHRSMSGGQLLQQRKIPRQSVRVLRH